MASSKIFEAFLEKLGDFPFWLKEIVYIKLREEFEQAYLSEADLHTPIEEAYQAYKPMITFAGKKELSEHNNQEDEAVYRFLKFAVDECSVAEITLRNFWTLEKTAKKIFDTEMLASHLFSMCCEKSSLCKNDFENWFKKL